MRRDGTLLWRLCVLNVVLAFPLVTEAAPVDVHAQLQEVIGAFKGHVTLAAKNLKTGETIEIGADEKVQTASVIKLPILIETFYQVKEKQVSLDSYVILDKENRVQGSGILQDLSDGLILTLQDTATLMIVLSDNTATNLVIDSVGIDNVNARMRKLGARNTKLFKKVFLPAPQTSEEQKKYGLGVTTAGDMLHLLEMLSRGELVDRAGSDAMIAILKKQRDRDGIPRYLSFDDLGENAGGVEVANKTGALDHVRNDVGLILTKHGTYAMAVFVGNSPDTRWTADNAATLTIARLAKILFDHFEQGATVR